MCTFVVAWIFVAEIVVAERATVWIFVVAVMVAAIMFVADRAGV